MNRNYHNATNSSKDPPESSPAHRHHGENRAASTDKGPTVATATSTSSPSLLPQASAGVVAESVMNKNSITIKNQQLDQIIPVADVKRMAPTDWAVLYNAERENFVSAIEAFGGFQQHITKIQRYHIATWMSEACAVLGWTSQTFFVSVHALDMYVTSTSHEIQSAEFGPLAAACLYFGAQLMESATDENVYTLQKFQALCPEVGQSEVVREAEVHLIDVLQGRSLCRKTPSDFFFLYLAQLKLSTDQDLSNLFKRLVQHQFLSKLYDLACCTSLVLYTSSIVFEVTGSNVVQCAILHGVEMFLQSGHLCEAEQIDTYQLFDRLCCEVFHRPGGFRELEEIYQIVIEIVKKSSHVEYNRPPFRPKATAVTPNSEQRLNDQMDIGKSLDWVKHQHPSNFGDLSFTPKSKTAVDISTKLRNLRTQRTADKHCLV